MESLASIMTRRSSCFILIIFFLCFSVHACNARTIKFRNPGSPGREFLSCKIGKKVRSTVDSFQSAQSNKLCGQPKKMKDLREETKYYVSRRSSEIVPFRFISLERSISWHVPTKKHDKLLRFYSDYARPHIRPPSHN